MPWRIGLVDSCGRHQSASAARRFTASTSSPCEPVNDPTGHGTRIAQILTADRTDITLLLGQVFDRSARTSPEAVALAIDWCRAQGTHLIHLSLGLAVDRPILADSIARALAADVLIVASVPARGAVPYPAAYAGVIRATGDARCTPGHWSMLDSTTFGGTVTMSGGAGASVGAAHVTRELTLATDPCSRSVAIETLSSRAHWRGAERRTTPP